MSSFGTFASALLQIPGVDAPQLSPMEWIQKTWLDGGWMMYFLGACALLGLVVIVWKLADLSVKGARTRTFLREVDTLLSERRINDALALARESSAPAARI
ncbi:MAG: hypothetical protein GWO02_01055, partial [Gammaproteobacteria bacterium]|nr:hypothetical protein [Gammaproteobacteria bacterium]